MFWTIKKKKTNVNVNVNDKCHSSFFLMNKNKFLAFISLISFNIFDEDLLPKKKLRNFDSHFLLLCSTFSFSFFFFLIQFVSSYLGKQQQQVTWPIPSIIESFDLFFALRPSQMVRHIQTQLSSLIMIGFYFVLFPNESNWNNKIKEITIY